MLNNRRPRHGSNDSIALPPPCPRPRKACFRNPPIAGISVASSTRVCNTSDFPCARNS